MHRRYISPYVRLMVEWWWVQLPIIHLSCNDAGPVLNTPASVTKQHDLVLAKGCFAAWEGSCQSDETSA